MGIFRGILIDGTRASIMIELYIDLIFNYDDAMLFNFAPTATAYKSPTASGRMHDAGVS